MDPLTAMHHAGVYQQHLCRLMEVVAGPVLASLRARSVEASLQLDQLQAMKAALVNAQAEGKREGVCSHFLFAHPNRSKSLCLSCNRWHLFSCPSGSMGCGQAAYGCCSML